MSEPNADELLSLENVLDEEFRAIARRRGLPEDGHQPDAASPYARFHGQERWALCLSGGGIRSATFALGVLQGLARCGLLQRFDYLSTVSGGGYVGGWLTSWIQRHEDGLAGVVRGLKMPLEGELEPSAIRHLREYSNYLTPKLGALSADTWTLIATYLRNLILHWLVLLPPLLLLLLSPKIGQQLVLASSPEPPALVFSVVLAGAAFGFWCLSRPKSSHAPGTPRSTLRVLARLASIALAVLAVVLLAMSAPWLLGPDTRVSPPPPMPVPAGLAIGAGILMLLAGMIFIDWNRPAAQKRRDEQSVVLALFLVPIMASAILLSLGWAWIRPTEAPSWVVLAGLGVALRLLSWWIPGFLPPHPKLPPQNRSRMIKDRIGRIFAAVATGAVGGILVAMAAELSIANGAGLIPDQAALYTCLAPPVLLAIFGFSEILFIGLASFWTEDEDREWWGRSGAWLLIAVLFWGGLRVVALFGPPLLAAGHGALSATLATGGIAGVLTAFLGFSSKTVDVKKSIEKVAGPLSVRELALTVLAPVFIVALFALLSLGIDLVLVGGGLRDGFAKQLAASAEVSPRGLFCAAVVLVIVAAITSFCVNVNKFSLHAMYRFRLIRAYLGASHKKRRPHPFTGFDPADNIPMHDIWPNPNAEDLAACDDAGERHVSGGKPQPIHIINIALNLVSGRKLAWQQRKAASFTVSPLHCGSRELGYRRSESYGGPREGISLGTAVTISGAAASPNMGYHSSAVVTFIMSLFNVRLGWWLGNPGPKGAKTYTKVGPDWAMVPLLAETFGLTDDESPYVYLSDGGHFENLGLYEMVLRRCRVIVVSDAGCDESCAFQDLGNAIRKIRIDLGIKIDLYRLPMRPRDANPSFDGGAVRDRAGSCCAIGWIHYPEGEKLDKGLLIYLKPGLYGGEPADVLNYAAKNPSFPHESTADQWFSEAQFESYRALGVHVVERTFGTDPIADPDDLEALEKRASAYAYPEP